MINAYHRPATLAEALALLARVEPLSVPLGGGTILNRREPARQAVTYEVVDLQALGLDRIESDGDLVQVGAAATLQAVLEHPAIPPALARALELEATFNLRQMATMAGQLVGADGRSCLALALLALDARLTWEPGNQVIALGDWLPVRKGAPAGESLKTQGPGVLITRITWSPQAALAFEVVARTPADLPLLSVAAAAWPSGRTRLAVGGWGAAPRLVLDGPEPGGADLAARDACSGAGDEWASAEYRQEMAGLLARRALEALAAHPGG